jgi:AcrR family transcriptional regulator
MARPRKASDEDVFEAALRMMNRLGPLEWTLSDVAREVGVTPSALVQRFGSKRDLQVALMEQWAGSARELFDGLRRRATGALDALYGYADVVAGMGESPGLAHHLAYLQIDLSDPDLRSRLRRQAADTRMCIRALLEEAVAAAELLPDIDTAGLARMVEVVLTGSLLVWGIHGEEGAAASSLRHSLDALLAPYLAGGP